MYPVFPVDCTTLTQDRVTRGYKYKMRYVYAHFPINVNLEKNADTGLYEVDIRNFVCITYPPH